MTNLYIFDAQNSCEEAPKGFEAVSVRIDAGLNSDLQWKAAAEKAREQISRGLRLFWELDFGLAEGLRYPLSHASQFMSFKLALDHFRNAFWPEFGPHTCGISLYRGSLDFTCHFLWDADQEKGFDEWLADRGETEITGTLRQLFCRDAVVEYLSLLANQLPRELMSCLMLDASGIEDPVQEAYLLSKEHFSCFLCFVKGGKLPREEFGWETAAGTMGFLGTKMPESELMETPKTGICLPTQLSPRDYGLIRKTLEGLESSFRLLPESLIAAEWEGLDRIFFPEGKLSRAAERMLIGFSAAGGEIISV